MNLASLALLLPLAAVACANDGIDPAMRTAPPGACGTLETHVFGIYGSGGKVVEINIDRPGKHNVVVSAHDATKWHITASNGAKIEHVYAVGYKEQKVALPAGTKLLKDSKDTTGVWACGYADGKVDGCDSAQLITLADKMLHHVSSFHGCRGASSWQMGTDMATSSDCSATAASTQYDSLAGCIAYMEGDNTCGNGSDTGGGEDPTGGSGSGSGSGSGTPEPGPVFY